MSDNVRNAIYKQRAKVFDADYLHCMTADITVNSTVKIVLNFLQTKAFPNVFRNSSKSLHAILMRVMRKVSCSS